MKPIKPKFKDTIKLDFDVTKRTKEILNQYAKYTKYSEGEILDMIALEILNDDTDFVQWLKNRRYKKRIGELILEDSNENNLIFLEEELGYEEVKETCEF